VADWKLYSTYSAFFAEQRKDYKYFYMCEHIKMRLDYTGGTKSETKVCELKAEYE